MSVFVSAFTLVVPDYDEAIAFYVETLGFVLQEDVQLNPDKRWVRIAPEGAQTSILLAKADSSDQVAAIGKQCGGRVGFFLQSDDFEADHARLTEKGVRFVEEPRQESYGTVAVFSDIFGNLWDLIQPK